MQSPPQAGPTRAPGSLTLVLRRRFAFGRFRGFTLLELMAVVAVTAILTAIAIPSYVSVMDRLKVQTVVHDLLTLSNLIERYKLPHGGRLPDALSDLKDPPTLDPWGSPYMYLNFASTAPGVKGKIRKDHNLHPLNSDFDLYSMGPDGSSRAPLTASASRDDIIWARDGGFIGKASDF